MLTFKRKTGKILYNWGWKGITCNLIHISLDIAFSDKEEEGVNRIRGTKKPITFCLVAVFLAVLVSRVDANIVIISMNNTEILGDSKNKDGDLISYDPATDTSALFFSESLFSTNENIDAVHVLPSGNIILSTRLNATVGGLSFKSATLVEYDPFTGTATPFLDETLLSQRENIDAVSVLSNGHIVLSTRTRATLGGLAFKDGDLIEYNPTTDIATLFLSEDLFSNNEDIDAVHVLDNGHIILSTTGNATLAELNFKNGDLVEYDPVNGMARIYFDEDLMQRNSENIDAVYVTSTPEPATIVLLGLGSLVLIRCRRQRA